MLLTFEQLIDAIKTYTPPKTCEKCGSEIDLYPLTVKTNGMFLRVVLCQKCIDKYYNEDL